MRDRHSSLAWGVPLVGLMVSCVAVTTEGGAWSPAERIDEPTDSPGWWVQVAMGASDTAFAAWDFASSDVGTVRSTHYTLGNGWSLVEQIDNNVADAYWPALAVDPNGNAVAV